MKNFQKISILIIFCAFVLLPQKANAITASQAVDKTIEYTAKGTYYITKYTLKTTWFITKKTAKGIKVISVSLYNATKDAFSPDKNTTPKNSPEYYEQSNTLPPPPPILDEY